MEYGQTRSTRPSVYHLITGLVVVSATYAAGLLALRIYVF